MHYNKRCPYTSNDRFHSLQQSLQSLHVQTKFVNYMTTLASIISGDYVKTPTLKVFIHEEKDNGHT